MSHISFEDSFRAYLSGQTWLHFTDNCNSYEELDFSLTGEGFLFSVELKEKKQKYNLLRWDGIHIPEEHFMIVDELSIRKIVLSGANTGLLIKDSVREKLFFFSMIDLVLMPHKKRFNRTMKLGKGKTLKGKWSLDLRNGQECPDFGSAITAIQEYAETIPQLKTCSSCINVYHGETITQGGIIRTTDYLNIDITEK